MKLGYGWMLQLKMHFGMWPKQEIIPIFQQQFLNRLILFHNCQWHLRKQLLIFLQLLTQYPFLSITSLNNITTYSLNNLAKRVRSLIFSPTLFRQLLNTSPIELILSCFRITIIQFPLLSRCQLIRYLSIPLKLISH